MAADFGWAGIGCGFAIGWTGIGAVACGALAGAIGSAVNDLVEGDRNLSDILNNAAVGAVFGGLTAGLGSVFGTGLKAGIGSLLGGAGLRTAGQAASSAARREAGDIIGGRITSGLLKPCNSFAAGTMVVMADGTHKAIENVKTGDKVLATDPTTGKTKSEAVTDTITGTGTKNLVQITVDTDDGHGNKIGVVIATDHHPFWIGGRLHKWVNAGDLKPGMWLRTSSGTYVQISAVKAWTQHRQVHNLTVDTTHTYYVEAGTVPVLVHNCGPGGSVEDLAAKITNNTHFHYTNEDALKQILATGGIRANSAGKVFVTQEMYSSEEAFTHVFAGSLTHAGRGSHVIAFEMLEGAGLRVGEQPNELIHQGSLRLGEVLYAGPNPFG